MRKDEAVMRSILFILMGLCGMGLSAIILFFVVSTLSGPPQTDARSCEKECAPLEVEKYVPNTGYCSCSTKSK